MDTFVLMSALPAVYFEQFLVENIDDHFKRTTFLEPFNNSFTHYVNLDFDCGLGLVFFDRIPKTSLPNTYHAVQKDKERNISTRCKSFGPLRCALVKQL